jgi:hypothetical protein
MTASSTFTRGGAFVGALAAILAGCAGLLDIHDPAGHLDDAGPEKEGGAELDAQPDAETDATPTSTRPDALSQLVLWLAPGEGVTTSAGQISRWQDQSPAHSDATARAGGAPAFVADARNGLPAVSFNQGRYLALGAGFKDFTAGLSAFVVTRPTTDASGGSARFFDFAPENSESNCILLCRQDNPSTQVWYQVWAGADGGKWDQPAIMNRLVAQSWQIFTVVAAAGDPSAQATVSMYENGALAGTGLSYVPNVVTRRSNFLGHSNYFGQSTNDPDYRGDIGEVVIFARALSDAERIGVHRYLSTKWAL